MKPRPIPFVLASTDHGTMIVNRLDYNAAAPGTYYGVGFQLLNTGHYEPDEIDQIKELLRKRRAEVGDRIKPVAIDCGANIGVNTIEMAREMNGWGQVIAIEAQERIYYALCGNIALSNLFNVSALAAAVGADSGWMQIPKPDYTKSASFGSLELRRSRNTEHIGQSIDYSTRALVTSQVVTIDNIVNLPSVSRVDFLKIDVEGMEMDVLHGAQRAITQYRPYILVEVIKTDQAALNAFFSDNNYSVMPSGMNWIALPNDVS